jgi:mannose/fructose/N-acetylgalactosamine-specific phosphotransferase system component IIC
LSIGIGTALVLLAWAGLCAADQRAIGSRQIHQPLVAAVVAGWILGAPDRGLLVGLWLQLVWPAPMPVGGALLPDTGSVAVAAAVLAAAIPGGEGLLIAILFGLLIAWISIPWERGLRTANGRVEEQVLAQDGTGLGRAILGGIAGPFLRGAVCAALAIAAALAAGRWIQPLPPARMSGSLTASLIGGAGTLGLSGLLARVQTETGRSWFSWTVAGLVAGGVGRLLLEALR